MKATSDRPCSRADCSFRATPSSADCCSHRTPRVDLSRRAFCSENARMLYRDDSAFASPSRRALAAELLVLAVLAAAFLVFFDARAGYVDLVLALVAVGMILAGGARSRAL